MAEPTSNKLFLCPVKVRPGPGCDMPSHLLGATVVCFVAALEPFGALRLAVEKLKARGFLFEDLVGGKVDQLDPRDWDQYVSTVWPEVPGHFPPQADVLDFVNEGGVFFGPFIGWDSKT